MIFGLISAGAAAAAIGALLLFALASRPITNDDWLDVFDEDDHP